jgi:hypothetical protein
MIALGLLLVLQNVVEEGGEGRTLPAVPVGAADLEAVTVRETGGGELRDPEARRLAAKLDAHVDEFVSGFPWMPFHHTLGISDYETAFGHPDRVFLALSRALPWLTPETARKTKAFLSAQLDARPPWSPEGYDPAEGAPRERYTVPDGLRRKARARGTGLLGVYAFWLYGRAAGGEAAWRTHAPALAARVAGILDADFRFDPRKRDYARDEAHLLNADLAGLIGHLRIVRSLGDADAERRTSARALDLLQRRLDLERLNPRILEKTSSASASLHVFKLARYCDLVPELAEFVAARSEGLAAERLRGFREARPAWWLAFGDRLVGGENYTNPTHFVEALFRGAACIERLPAERLLSFADIPWCRGDLHAVELWSLALWAAAGRP